MGADKCFVRFQGVPLVERAAATLAAAGAAPIHCVGGDQDRLAQLGLAVIADRHPDAGPLGGLLTALSIAQHQRVIVLAVDHLEPSSDAIERMVSTAVAGDHDVVVPLVDGEPQVLHAVWHRRLLDRLTNRFASGERSVRQALTELEVCWVRDLDPARFRDADRPEDLRVPSDAMEVPEIDINEAHRRLADGAELLDVRQPDEYEEIRVEGGRLLPLDELPERLDEVPVQPGLLVICRTGGRSAKAVEYLRRNGIDAINVSGGTLGWAEAGHPTTTGPAAG